MPKLIDNILNGKPPLTPSPNEIEARIREAEASAAQLDAEHSRAALEAEGGASGASERLAASVERRQAHRARLETLRSALVAAREDEERRRARLQAKLHRENLSRVTAALDRRDEAAARLSQHIEAAVAAWHDLVDWSDKATIPLAGTGLPPGSMTGLGELRRAVERELYRLGAGSIDHTRDFPGGRAHDLELLDLPERLPSLAAAVKEASGYAVSHVGGEPAEASA